MLFRGNTQIARPFLSRKSIFMNLRAVDASSALEQILQILIYADRQQKSKIINFVSIGIPTNKQTLFQ